MNPGRTGAVLLITNASGSKFLMQQKDETHPIVPCRKKFSLFGGSLEGGETPHEALVRELTEEILEPRFVSWAADRMDYWKKFSLIGNQYPGQFPCHVFVLVFSGKVFDHFAERCLQPGVVVEGRAVAKTKEELMALFSDTNNFIASMDRVLRSWIDEEVNR